MLGELVTAGLGPAHVDSLYELCDRVRAAEQDKDPPPPAGLPLRPKPVLTRRGPLTAAFAQAIVLEFKI